jgi:hypothetical protein
MSDPVKEQRPKNRHASNFLYFSGGGGMPFFKGLHKHFTYQIIIFKTIMLKGCK